MARSLAALVALALALPAPAAAHPFAPRSILSVGTAPAEPAPATDPGPWTPSPGAPSSAPTPQTGSPAPAPAPQPTSPGPSPVSQDTSTAIAPKPVPRATSTATGLAPSADVLPTASAPVPEATSSAAPPPPHPTFVRPAVDIPVIALGAALWFGTEYGTGELRWAGCGACDPAAVNGLDRRVIGNEDRAAARGSDVLLAAAIGLPFVADLGDALASGRRQPGGVRHAAGGWLRDAVVLAEVLTVNLGLTNIVKFAVRRPRPYSYDPDSALADPTENDARLSFYSGHASSAFAMLTAYAMLFTLRHPRARAAVPVWLAAVGLATTTGILRVVAGKHFWTDVLTGAVSGAAIGVLVPALHATRWRRLTPGLSWAPRGALVTLGARF